MFMSLGPDYQPDYVSLRDKLLEIAQIRSVGELMDRVVGMLAERPHIAFARIWLLNHGDRCPTCEARYECLLQERCLHLVASAAAASSPAAGYGARLDGPFARIPPGVGKVGRVFASGQGITITDYQSDAAHAGDDHDWAREQGIRGFNAQPIKFRQEVLGVAAVFTLIPLPRESPGWLRVFADHIAAAVVNARAFEEIDRLRARLELENRYLQEEVKEARAVGEIIGYHPSIRDLQAQIEMVAPTDVSVLILGESGTGKELVAREIHRLSLRKERPLIRVNCASVPHELYESEFFGHAKGSFTGAIRDRAGRFEAADGGTLLLDEIGEIPLQLQSKFLRVLQEKQYERVGEERTRTVNVRIIAATNRDLKKEVAAGRFREDLFYRLSVFPLSVPPLRERKSDIPALARHFLDQAARRMGRPIPRLTEELAACLQSYDWPGNVRELQNAAERAVILSQRGSLRFDLPIGPPQPAAKLPATTAANGEPQVLTEPEMQSLERQNLRAALEQCGWKVHGEAGAARLLRVKPTTLISRIKKLGLKRPETGPPTTGAS